MPELIQLKEITVVSFPPPPFIVFSVATFYCYYLNSLMNLHSKGGFEFLLLSKSIMKQRKENAINSTNLHLESSSI